MKLNRKWGYGQLFGFSSIDGANRYYEDTIMMTMKKAGEFRYEFKDCFVKVYFDTDERIKTLALMSDFFLAKAGEADLKLTYIDNDTLIGVSPVMPTLKGSKAMEVATDRGATIYSLGKHHFGVRGIEEDGHYKFVIHHSFAFTEARAGANYFIEHSEIEPLIEQRMLYLKNMPKCMDKRYESLYYKCLSVNKVNMHSPEGKIAYRWTTPDRVPHRHMWLWDSVFHALAIKEYDVGMAKDAILAMITQMRDDGFMPHMSNPTDCSDVTQPCVIAWGVLKVYEKCGDVEFLKQCVPYLDKYLSYDMENRDENGNGLLEWYTEPEYGNCKCGESGLDNSPRFDFDEKMDCMDFSTYFALDTECLSRIYSILGDETKAAYWKDIHEDVSKKINEFFYDAGSGVYYDRLFSGRLTKVLTHSSFLPMFAGIMSEEQVKKMIPAIFDETELYSKAPLASISMKDPRFSNDMWRGGVWLNLNYFIISGLMRYGFVKEAQKLREDTLKIVDKWYKKTGCIFEFYDPKDEVSPFMCHRKGDPLKSPDYRKHVHSISDYNWSACFTLLLIQGVYH